MSDLKITGKITKILDVEKGTAKSGSEWQKISFVVNNGNEYNPDTAFGIFGEEKVENFLKYNKVGDDVEVSFNAHSREFNSKWYNSLDAWKVWKVGAEGANGGGNDPVGQPQAQPSDDLPF